MTSAHIPPSKISFIWEKNHLIFVSQNWTNISFLYNMFLGTVFVKHLEKSSYCFYKICPKCVKCCIQNHSIFFSKLTQDINLCFKYVFRKCVCKTSSICIRIVWVRFYIYAQMCEILHVDIFTNFEPKNLSNEIYPKSIQWI